jgi:molybdate transport system substrate-binding protein
MPNALTVISSMATRQILSELAAAFSAGGQATQVESVGGVEAARRIRAGEHFDVVVLADAALRNLAADGFIAAATIAPFAISPTAIAILAGASRPDTIDAAAIKTLIATPARIAVSTGPSGVSVRKLFQSWDLGEAIAQRIIEAPPGVPTARLIASGQADVGFQQLSELRGEAGIDIAGVVPSDLLPVTVFSTGLCTGASDPAGARALQAYLLAPSAAATKRRHGMESAA